MIRAWLFWGEYGFYLGKIFTASKLGDIRLKYRKGVDTIEREYGSYLGKKLHILNFLLFIKTL